MFEPCVFEFSKAFNQDFAVANTQLTPGADEPFYQAPQASKVAQIFSNQDFFSSALHEIAHWCIAGEKRRQQNDYGYWYAPDGRSNEQQADFFRVEVKPQALEWAFHLAANCSFEFSLDNLNNQVCNEQIANFKAQVYRQLGEYFSEGFPPDALKMIQLLCRLYRQHQPIQYPAHYV